MKLHLRLYSKSVGHSENKERLGNVCQRRHSIQLQSSSYLRKTNQAQISTHVVTREYFHHPCYIYYFRLGKTETEIVRRQNFRLNPVNPAYNGTARDRKCFCCRKVPFETGTLSIDNQDSKSITLYIFR